MSSLERVQFAMPRDQHRTPIVYLAVLASSVGFPSFPAQAADSGKDQRTGSVLEEIVVTAAKRQELLLKVPMAVAVVDSQALADTNQVRIQDYIARVPGVSFTPSGNGGEPTLVIRGIVTGAEANPTVGYVVDDVPYGASTATGPNVVTAPDIDPGDLERIEVLRGPQGTLYGSASIGGLVKFVTRDPSTEEASGRLQVGTTSIAHSDDFGYSIRGVLNVPLGDQAAVRISAFDLTEPGYIDNTETGEADVNSFDSSGVRLTALWRLGSDWSVRLNGFHQDSERDGSGDVDAALGGLRQAFLNGTGVYEREVQGYSATIQGNLGPIQITSVTGYNEDRVFSDVDSSDNPFLVPLAQGLFGVDHAISQVQRDTDKFSQELRLMAPLGDSVQLLTGLFYTDEDVVLDADNVAADDSGRRVGSLYDNLYNPAEFEERAVFANLTVDSIPRWQFQLGGRYSETSQTLRTTFIGPGVTAFFPTDPFTTGTKEFDDDAVTYAASARFELTDNAMVYARIATGYRPGGPNVACGINDIPCDYDSDSSQNFELGTKGRISDALQYEVAAYFIKWDDIQIPNILTPDFLFFYTANASEAESKGVELALEARPISQLRLFTSAAYNNAELTEGFPPGTFQPAQPGDRLPFSPRWSATAGFDVEVPVGAQSEFSIGATVSYVDDRVQAFTFTGPGDTLPSYTGVDLRAGLQIADWALNVFVNNATDKKGVLRSSFPLSDHFTYMRPRTMGLTLSKTF
jgi:iron complex outermembrane recepter protein